MCDQKKNNHFSQYETFYYEYYSRVTILQKLGFATRSAQ